MNWGDIKAEILRSLKEKSVTEGHWTEPELLRRANIGHRKIIRFTGCLKATTPIATIVGQAEYSKATYFPNGIYRITRVTFANKKLYSTTKASLDENAVEGKIDSPWTDKQDTPTNYYDELDVIGTYPKPSSIDTLSVEHIPPPIVLTTDNSIPFNGLAYLEDYHDLIAWYVIWRCLLEDGDDRFAEYKNDFIDGVRSLKSEVKNKPDELWTFSLLRAGAGKTKKALPFLE